MKILIAEDDPGSRRILELFLMGWGYEVVITCNGAAAWQALQADNPPQIALLDWMLPEMDGPEICRRVRSTAAGKAIYIILISARSMKDDIIAGFDSGADDYITKPFDRQELRVRLRAGSRIVELQTSLTKQLTRLEDSAARIIQLHDLLPICGWCKNVRNDRNYWQQVEFYLSLQSELQLTQGICPTCKEQATAGRNSEKPI
jgi:sigma-B regulation protein RsbU (phosphoserine phosphatase)